MGADSTAPITRTARYDPEAWPVNRSLRWANSDSPRAEILARYPLLTDDHLRYLRKWGLVGPTVRAPWPDGAPTGSPTSRASARSAPISPTASRSRPSSGSLLADSQGQLALDFQSEPAPAQGDQAAAASRGRAGGHYRRRRRRPTGARSGRDPDAEALFLSGSAIDSGDPATLDDAVGLYRRGAAPRSRPRAGADQPRQRALHPRRADRGAGALREGHRHGARVLRGALQSRQRDARPRALRGRLPLVPRRDSP